MSSWNDEAGVAAVAVIVSFLEMMAELFTPTLFFGPVTGVLPGYFLQARSSSRNFQVGRSYFMFAQGIEPA
jgi:hypothetical protein